MEDNDFIFVDVYEKLVLAQGNFKRPMYYQLRKEEGGKNDSSPTSKIERKTIAASFR